MATKRYPRYPRQVESEVSKAKKGFKGERRPGGKGPDGAPRAIPGTRRGGAVANRSEKVSEGPSGLRPGITGVRIGLADHTGEKGADGAKAPLNLEIGPRIAAA